MLCGIEWWAFISRKNTYRICRLCSIKVSKDYNSKRELLVNDEPNTWQKDGKYRNWIIQIKKDSEGYKLKVRGSLHKFYHTHNKGKFSGIEVLAAIQGMLDLFEVDPAEATVLNIEVGINLPVSFLVYAYLQANLIYHKKKEREGFKDKGIGFYFKYDDYWLKVYAKDKHILRFEIKYKSKDKLSLFGIATISDLQQVVINRLADSLLPEWMEVVMRGGINLIDEKNTPHHLSKKERVKLLEFTSIGYQQSYNEELDKANAMGDRKRSDALRKKANRLKKFCLEIINDRGDGIHKELGRMIAEGIKEFKGTWAASGSEGKQNVTISPFDKMQETVTFNNINKRVKNIKPIATQNIEAA